jgi:integrase
VLSRDEVRVLLADLRPPMQLIAPLLYGAGLRLMECLPPRVKDLDFSARILVRRGKGGNARWSLVVGR